MQKEPSHRWGTQGCTREGWTECGDVVLYDFDDAFFG